MLQELLADTQPSVFRHFKLENPVVDRFVQLDQRFFLLEQPFLGECDGFAFEIGDHALLQLLSPSTEGSVGFSEIVTAIIKYAQFLNWID